MKKNLIIIGIGIVLVGAGLMAWGYFGQGESEIVKLDDTNSTPAGIQEVVNANNKFAFDFYSEINKKEEGNIFYSPYSIFAALAMTYEGAKGKTADEIKSVFSFPESEILRPNFAAIYNKINKKNDNYKLSTGNALWAQYDYRFLDDFTSRIEKYYGGKVTNLDFVKETEKSRKTINDFIAEQTNNKIKDLIPKGALTVMTRLVLTNAIYFKGTWVKQFDKKDTRDEDFTTISGQKIKAPLMRLTGDEAEFKYAENDDLQILEMPYNGEDLSMLVILPKENNFEKVEQSLNNEKLSEWKNMLREQRVDIFIPKFKFDSKSSLKSILQNMGMPTAFSEGSADFSGMDGTKNLLISDVIHQAFVEVNEEGTEAAAATAVIMKTLSIPPPSPIFRADRPFIFLIEEKATGNILFLGRIANPKLK